MIDLNLEYQRLLEKNEWLEKDNKRLEKEIEHVREFYGLRFKSLQEKFKDTDYYEEVCCILANGVPNIFSKHDWALTSERDFYKYKCQRLEANLKSVKIRIKEKPTWNQFIKYKKGSKDYCQGWDDCCEWITNEELL